MTQALTVYDRVTDPIAFCNEQAVAAAAMIAGTTPDQGKAIAMVCLTEGINYIEFIRRYHWIPNKGPSMRSDAMLSEFRMNHGGDYEIIESTSYRAEIKFIDSKGRELTCVLTMEDCLLSRWPWKSADDKGNKPGWKTYTKRAAQLFTDGKNEAEVFAALSDGFKDNWATLLDWEAMLIARLSSSGVRKICPEVNSGIYTPEEMADVADSHSGGQQVQPKTASEFLGNQPGSDNEQPGAEPGVVVDAKVVSTTESILSGDESDDSAEGDQENLTDARLIDSIRTLAEQAFGDKAHDAIAAALKKRKASVLKNLSTEQLVELQENLRAAAQKKKDAVGN